MDFNRCIRNLLKFICVLQNNSVNFNCHESGCTRKFLGPIRGSNCFNTRVIALYNKLGEEFSTIFNINGIQNMSSRFRVHSVDGDCCVLLILDKVDGRFISTRQYITVKISCICAIKCVQDVSISNL